MLKIELTKELSIKKMDPLDPKDLWLIQQLNNDKVVLDYLNNFNHIFTDISYLESDILLQQAKK